MNQSVEVYYFSRITYFAPAFLQLDGIYYLIYLYLSKYRTLPYLSICHNHNTNTIDNGNDTIINRL